MVVPSGKPSGNKGTDMNTGGNQAAINADVFGVAVVAPAVDGTRRLPGRAQLAARLQQWFAGRSEARALAQAERSEHVELHWQKMHDDYSESWRWQANGF